MTPCRNCSRLSIRRCFCRRVGCAHAGAESESALAKLAPGHDFQVVNFADAGHRLLSVPRDIKIETFRSSGFTVELLPVLRRWLAAHTSAK